MSNSYWQALVDRQEGFTNFTPELHAALREAKVAILGAGGNGAVAELLLRAGFCRFIIIDPDVIEDTNLNRLPFSRKSIGKPKADAWKEFLESINPDCDVAAYHKGITRHDGEWLKKLLDGVDLIFLGTTDVEANLVSGRVAFELGIRTIIGPASSGSCIVSTFTHDNNLSLEKLAGFGTESIPLESIDYAPLLPQYMKAMAFPGRRNNVTAKAWEGMRSRTLAARSCGIFVRLTNAAMAFEGVKNIAVLRGLPLERTQVVAIPEVQVFDPWSGSAYRFNILTGEIGIPNWLTGDIAWNANKE